MTAPAPPSHFDACAIGPSGSRCDAPTETERGVLNAILLDGPMLFEFGPLALTAATPVVVEPGGVDAWA